MGMVEEKTVYALTGAEPWVDFNNPGAYRDRTDGTASTVQQKDAEAIYLAHKAIFDSQTNVRRTAIDALNLAVPREYKRYNTNTQIGAKIYKANSDPREILDALRYNYVLVLYLLYSRGTARFSASMTVRRTLVCESKIALCARYIASASFCCTVDAVPSVLPLYAPGSSKSTHGSAPVRV